MKPPTPENVCAMMLGGFRVAKLWSSIRMLANRFGCDRSVITRIVGLLEERGEIPLRRERDYHNNRVRSKIAMNKWRRKSEKRKPGDLLNDEELAVLYAGRRYTDVKLVRP